MVMSIFIRTGRMYIYQTNKGKIIMQWRWKDQPAYAMGVRVTPCLYLWAGPSAALEGIYQV